MSDIGIEVWQICAGLAEIGALVGIGAAYLIHVRKQREDDNYRPPRDKDLGGHNRDNVLDGTALYTLLAQRGR